MVLNCVGYESMRLVEFFLCFWMVFWVGVVVLLDVLKEKFKIGNGRVFCYFFLLIELDWIIGLVVYVYGVFVLIDNRWNFKWFGFES